MALIPPHSIKGVLELLPHQQIAFQRLLDRARHGFERFGYLPIETPAIERTEVLLTKSGGETEKQVYFVQSTGARAQGSAPDLALRFDLTVPLARYVALHEGKLSFPFRRYQIQPVYRGERPQRGRYREFYQCDLDVIGKDELDLLYDAEVPAAMIGVLESFDIGPFTLQLNHRKLLRGILSSIGIAPEQQADVLREIDKLDKRGPEHLRQQLQDELGLSATRAGRVLDFVQLAGPPRDVLKESLAFGGDDPVFREGHAELDTVIGGLEALGVSADRYRLNLAIARGLDYYTGTIYETTLDAHPEFGSICSGGRYENLAGFYTASKLPGVGLSIGATRLFSFLLEQGLVPEAVSSAQVLVTQQDPKFMRDYLAFAGELRRADIPTEVILEPWKFKKQMKFANATGVRLVVIMGEKEQANGRVVVKDMVSGEQHDLAHSELVSRVRALLRGGEA